MATEQHQSIRGKYASRILGNFLRERYRMTLPDDHQRDRAELPEWRFPILKDLPRADPPLPSGKVGIVGAGMAGLYLAMMCDFLNIEYEILESSERIGGRVYTYQFPNNIIPPVTHNYYDVGAMRFPVLRTMQPVRNLIDQLRVPIAPYYLSNSSTPNLFNNASVTSNEITNILQPLDKILQPIIQKLQQDFDAGFAALMLLDKYSTRQYLSTENSPPMSFAEIQKLETYNTSTGLFDQAFAETVLDYFDFNVAESWYRIELGTTTLAEAMYKSIRSKPLIRKRVNNIAYNGQTINVKVDGEVSPRSYYAAFNTTTMGCLGQMDTSGLRLSVDQQTAIRALSYDRSCKIAIRFRRAWWVNFGVTSGMGGSSATDLPIRTTVYPSWVDGDPNQPAVLICSYTWALDATKIGSLIANPNDPSQNAKLLELVLRNLARVFGNRITYEELNSLVQSHHAYAWSHDPNTAGAFALFGPGQFTNLYPAVQMPAADGRFWMVGECVSAHHAWIVGALDSAYIQLLGFLTRFKQLEKIAKLKESWFGGGVNKHSDEIADQEELVYWKAKLSVDEDLGF